MADVLADFVNDRSQRARREYQCDAGCRKPITRGEVYVYTAAKVDGEMETLREHVRCHELERRLRDYDGHFLFGELWNAPEWAVSPSNDEIAEWVSIMERPWTPHEEGTHD